MPEWSDELFFVIASHLPTTRALIQFSTACKRSNAAVKTEWLAQFKKAKDAIEVLTIQPSSKWIEIAHDSISINVAHFEECSTICLMHNSKNNSVVFSFSKTYSPSTMVMFCANYAKDEVHISDMRESFGGPTMRTRDLLQFIQEKVLRLPAGMTLATLQLAETAPDEDERKRFIDEIHGRPFKAKPSSNTSKPFRKRDTTAPPQLGPIFAQSRDVCST